MIYKQYRQHQCCNTDIALTDTAQQEGRMAISQSKRNVRRAQPAHRSVATPKTSPASNWSKLLKPKSFHFSQLKGKVLEGVEFTSSPDYDALILSFQDNTFADFIIETCFSVKAGYLDRNGGNHRILKKWPRMHSVQWRRR